MLKSVDKTLQYYFILRKYGGVHQCFYKSTAII